MKSDDIIIRKAIVDDFEKLKPLYNELDELHRSNHPEIFVDNTIDIRTKNMIEEIIKNPEKELFIAEIKSEIVGLAECYTSYSLNNPIFKKRKWIQLNFIVVKQEYQMLNIGSLLLEKVKKWAKEREINEIELNVFSFNKSAIEFYNKKGFRDISKKMHLDIN